MQEKNTIEDGYSLYDEYYTDEDEIFAEVWRQYKQNPDNMKEYAPKLYENIEEVDKLLRSMYEYK